MMWFICHQWQREMSAMVEMRRLELLTPCLQSRCSSQLSYIPG